MRTNGAAIQCATPECCAENGLPHFEQKRAAGFQSFGGASRTDHARVPYQDAVSDRNSTAHIKILSNTGRIISQSTNRIGPELTSRRKRDIRSHARQRAQTATRRRSVGRNAPCRSAAPWRTARRTERAFDYSASILAI